MNLRETEREAVTSLAADIEKAIQLREMLFQREMDRKFREAGGRIFYAIDSVILHRLFPTGDDLPASLDRLRVFSGPPGTQPSPSEVRVWSIIANDLVRNLVAREGDESPLILLPGHAEEAYHLHDRLLRGIERDRKDRGRESARTRLRKILRRLEGPTNLAYKRLTEDEEDALHTLLYEIEESTECLKRFNKLIANGQLRSASKLYLDPRWRPILDDKILAALEEKDEPGGERENVEGSADWWQRRLPASMPAPFAERDKRALATLDRLNRLLIDKKIEGKRMRVILLTENEAIMHVGAKYRPFRNSHAEEGQYSFSDLYIRLPTAMMFEPDILLPGGTDLPPADRTGWLDAFLTKAVKGEAQDLLTFRKLRSASSREQRLQSIANAALGEWQEAHQTLFREWLDHLNNITTAHVSTSAMGRASIALRLGPDGEAGMPRLEELERKIEDLTEESWDDFFLTAAKSGYEMIGLSQEKVQGQRRNVPRLYLRQMDIGEKLLDLIYEPTGVIANERSIRELLARLDRDTSRYSRYLSALCYALLFAFADRWPVARTLAKRAVEIAEIASARDGLSESDKVTGREGYYLAAVTHRLTARTKADLRDSQVYLARARVAMSRSLDDGGDSESAPMTGLRFAAEDIARKTAEILFDASQARWALSGRSDLVARIRETMQQALKLLAEDPCSEPRVKGPASMGVRTNYFSNLFLLECAGEVEPRDLRPVKELVDAQLDDVRNIGGSARVDLSAVDMQALIYAQSFVGDDAEPPPLNGGFESSTAAPFLMPYDRGRYERMAQLANKRRIGREAQPDDAPVASQMPASPEGAA